MTEIRDAEKKAESHSMAKDPKRACNLLLLLAMPKIVFHALNVPEKPDAAAPGFSYVGKYVWL